MADMLLSRRKLFEKIVAHVAKRKLENHVQATGDRMATTPQQFGMQIAKQTKQAGLEQLGTHIFNLHRTVPKMMERGLNRYGDLLGGVTKKNLMAAVQPASSAANKAWQNVVDLENGVEITRQWTDPKFPGANFVETTKNWPGKDEQLSVLRSIRDTLHAKAVAAHEAAEKETAKSILTRLGTGAAGLGGLSYGASKLTGEKKSSMLGGTAGAGIGGLAGLSAGGLLGLLAGGALGGQRGAGLGMLGGGALGLGAGGYLGGNVGASIGKKKKPAATDNKEQKEDETDEKLAGILPANLLSRVGGMFRGKVAPAASALAKPVTAAPLASAAEAASKLPTHHMRPDELHKLFQQGVATQRGAALHSIDFMSPAQRAAKLPTHHMHPDEIDALWLRHTAKT